MVIGAARAAAAILIAATGSAAGPSPPKPHLHDAAPCPGVAGFGFGFTCSTLDVPLDRSGTTPGTLHLRVAASDRKNAPRGVLLVLTGGPGEASLPIVDRIFDRVVAAEQQAYRIVVFDQRGTGAGALDCGALQRQMGSSDLYPPSAAAVRACAAKVGSRRPFFGTDDVVADIEALRQALGVDRLTLDGISYGTYVGERYALAHPSRVAKLVLDSVVPHVGLSDLAVAEFRATARVLRAACGGSCVSDLAAVVHRYHDGPRLLDALTTDSIVDPTFRQPIDIPLVLRRARAGDPTLLEQFLATVHTWNETPAGRLDQGLHASTLCADWRYPWGDSSAPLRGRTAALRRAVARLPASSLYPFDRQTASGNGFVQQCLPWPPTSPTPLATGKITVPTLLLNGDRDLSTPLEWARDELKLTTHGRLVVVPGAGHSTQSRASSNVGRAAVAAFLLR
jgi:pimeloyl-ACP methyl ester carboxylesterase